MALAAGTLILAERYARALLDVAIDKGLDATAIAGELETVASVVAEHPSLAEALGSPSIAPETRVAILHDVLSRGQVSDATRNLLQLLVERERIAMLSLVATQYRRLLQEHHRIQPGEVKSAVELNDDQRKRLADSLGRALGKTMELDYSVDRDLLGGVVVRIGNRVYDASVITQLQRFKDQALSSL